MASTCGLWPQSFSPPSSSAVGTMPLLYPTLPSVLFSLFGLYHALPYPSSPPSSTRTRSTTGALGHLYDVMRDSPFSSSTPPTSSPFMHMDVFGCTSKGDRDKPAGLKGSVAGFDARDDEAMISSIATTAPRSPLPAHTSCTSGSRKSAKVDLPRRCDACSLSSLSPPPPLAHTHLHVARIAFATHDGHSVHCCGSLSAPRPATGIHQVRHSHTQTRRLALFTSDTVSEIAPVWGDASYKLDPTFAKSFGAADSRELSKQLGATAQRFSCQYEQVTARAAAAWCKQARSQRSMLHSRNERQQLELVELELNVPRAAGAPDITDNYAH
ncbi:hypothetical protein C8R45DRAFT_920308 [Mycena sanguinolenta]|nr:hypothetical protein C8R45DRAFT_920308 [Mycena sanguinolenta]